MSDQFSTIASGQAPKVLIADDHPLFRVGLSYALAGLGFEVAGEAPDGEAAVRFCRSTRVDLVVLDVRMPGLDGISACRQIRALPTPPGVVMLSTYQEPAILQAAREAGANAFLSKETRPAVLARVLARVAVEPELVLLPSVELPPLTPRETEVLRLLVTGQTNKQIARELGISPETVKDHLNNLYRKLDAGDRVTAARRAVELGIA